MRCSEECPAASLSGLAFDNVAYCKGLVDVNLENSDVQLRNVCGALVMSKVTYGQIKATEVSLSGMAENDTEISSTVAEVYVNIIPVN